MMLLKILTGIVAIIIAAGEIARWWGDPRFLPLAFDELLVAAFMLAAIALARSWGALPFVAAWSLFCGFVLALLVPTLDHLLYGPPKESAGFYAVILAVMLAIGGWALSRSILLSRVHSLNR